MPRGPVGPLGQFFPIRVSPLIVPKAYGIPVSRKGNASTKQRKSFPHKRLYTRVVSVRLAGTRERSRVSPRLSRVCGWHRLADEQISGLAINEYLLYTMQWCSVGSDSPNGPCYHFGLRASCFAWRVFLPFAPFVRWDSWNFLLAYRFASVSSTSSSTKVRLRSARVRFSLVAPPNGVLVATTVPIFRQK
jgi:hypothetical protein